MNLDPKTNDSWKFAAKVAAWFSLTHGLLTLFGIPFVGTKFLEAEIPVVPIDIADDGTTNNLLDLDSNNDELVSAVTYTEQNYSAYGRKVLLIFLHETIFGLANYTKEWVDNSRNENSRFDLLMQAYLTYVLLTTVFGIITSVELYRGIQERKHSKFMPWLRWNMFSLILLIFTFMLRYVASPKQDNIRLLASAILVVGWSVAYFCVDKYSKILKRTKLAEKYQV